MWKIFLNTRAGTKTAALIISFAAGLAISTKIQAKEIQFEVDLQVQTNYGLGYGLFGGLVGQNFYFLTPYINMAGLRGDLNIKNTDLWFNVNSEWFQAGQWDPAPYAFKMELFFSQKPFRDPGQFRSACCEVGDPPIPVQPYYSPTQAQVPVQLNYVAEGVPSADPAVLFVAESYHTSYSLDIQSGDGYAPPESGLVQRTDLTTANNGLFIQLQGSDVNYLNGIQSLSFTLPGDYNYPPPATLNAVHLQFKADLTNYQIYADPQATGNNFTNPANNTITIEPGDNAYNALSFQNDGDIVNNDVLKNRNRLLNNGSIHDTGTLNNLSLLINHGMIENTGTFDNHDQFIAENYAVTNNATGTINNFRAISIGSSSIFSNKAEMNNSGSIYIADGEFINETNALLDNSGTISVNAGAILSNSGTISQKGKVYLEAGSVLTNDANGTIHNLDTINVSTGGEIQNQGEYIGEPGSLLKLAGGKFTNTGTMTLNPGLAGAVASIDVGISSEFNNSSGTIKGGSGSFIHVWALTTNSGTIDINQLDVQNKFLNYGDFKGNFQLINGIVESSKLFNTGSLYSNGDNLLSDGSELYNYGDMQLDKDSTLILSGAKIIGIGFSGTGVLTNFGEITVRNNSELTGEIYNTNKITLNGANLTTKAGGNITNTGIVNIAGDSAWTIEEQAKFNNTDGDLSGVTGVVNNDGRIINDGEMRLSGSSQLVNNGLFEQSSENAIFELGFNASIKGSGSFIQHDGNSSFIGRVESPYFEIRGGVSGIESGAEFTNNLAIGNFYGDDSGYTNYAVVSTVSGSGANPTIGGDVLVGATGKLIVETNSTLVVGGAVSDNGKVLINGELQVGALNGEFFYLNPGSELGGSGKIKLLQTGPVSGNVYGKVVMNGGTLKPGDPVTFTIDGDLVMNSGLLDIQVDGSGNHDVIKVTGNTEFNGGTVKIDYMNDYFEEPGKNIPWLSVDGSTTGLDSLHTLYAYTQSSGQLHPVHAAVDYLIGVTGPVFNELTGYRHYGAIETRTGGSLSNQNGGVFANYGTLTNQYDATLNNTGIGTELENNNTLINTDQGSTLNNQQQAHLANYGTLLNKNGAVLNNQTGGVIYNWDELSNQTGAVVNNLADGRIQNSMTINNGARFQNDGAIDNVGNIYNAGTFIVGNSGSLTGTGVYIQTDGVTHVDAGPGQWQQTETIIQGGKLEGSGYVGGPVTLNGGTLAPGGLSPLTVEGDLFVISGLLDFKVAGPGNSDFLNISGFASFYAGSTVEIDFINGYVPTLTDSLSFLITAKDIYGFDNLQFLSTGLPEGLTLSFNQNGNSLGWTVSNTSAVPLPASAWLMGSVLAGLGLAAKRRKESI